MPLDSVAANWASGRVDCVLIQVRRARPNGAYASASTRGSLTESDAGGVVPMAMNAHLAPLPVVAAAASDAGP